MAAAEVKAEADVPAVTSHFWFDEEVTPDFAVKMRLESIDFQAKSDFQDVKIIKTTQFGKTLVLDGKTQSASNDEHIYHESLVHPAMLLHPCPRTVYIGGGGEMATAREILRHKSVEKVVMVDIDQIVCDIAFEQLPQWSAGVREDPRFELHCEDAKAFLENDNRKYDVIIMDIADPIEAGPGIALYTQEFYQFATQRMNPGGIIVTQSGPGSHFNVQSECFTTIHKTMRSVFNHVYPYSVDIPSFGSNWGFNMACGFGDSDEARSEPSFDTLMVDVKSILAGRSTDEINAAIAERITGEQKFYDGITHLGMFGIPIDVRKAIVAEDRIMTIENPVFMH